MRTAAELDVEKAKLGLQRLEAKLFRLRTSASSEEELSDATFDVAIQRLELERLETFVTKERRMSDPNCPDPCPCPCPSDMGFTDEVVDVIQKAGVAVETVATAVQQTGKQAVDAISAIIKAVRASLALLLLLGLAAGVMAQPAGGQVAPPLPGPKVTAESGFEPEGKTAPMKRADGCGCEQGGKCGCQVCLCDLSYKGAYNHCLATGTPMVVFVGQAKRPIAACVVCRADEVFPKCEIGVMVGMRTEKGDEIYMKELPGHATDRDIGGAVLMVAAALKPNRQPWQTNFYTEGLPQTSYFRPYGGFSGGCAGGSCSRR